MEIVPRPAKAASRHRKTPIPRGDWLSPLWIHTISGVPREEWPCLSVAGRSRPRHEWDREGNCVFCPATDASQDQPLGSAQKSAR